MILFWYNIIVAICKLSLPIFFSDIEVVGKSNVPPSGPIIIIGNHPNELLDVLVIGTTCGRPLSFWAKSTLFRGKLMNKILRALGALPVKRKMDSNGTVTSEPRMDNAQLEQESFKAFEEGRAMCVFPEGTSHSEAHILHLKDGTSWTKFEYYDRNDGNRDIPVIPCGITYINKHKWRSQVVIQFGKPICLTPERLTAFRASPKSEVKKLTEEMEQILYSLTLNSPDWPTLKLLHTARRIYMGDTPLSVAEYVEVTRRFAHFYNKSKDDKKVKILRKELSKYQEGLDRLHLKDVNVRKGFTFWASLWRVIDRLFFILVLLPLALPGFLVNFPIIAIGILANIAIPHQESKATLKFLTALVFVPILYTCLAVALWYFFSAPFLITLLILPLVGAAYVRILEEEVMTLRYVMSSLRSIWSTLINSQNNELKSLLAQRKKLEISLTKMVEQYATPEQRTLDIKEKVSIAPTKKIVPTLIRRDSFSESFL